MYFIKLCCPIISSPRLSENLQEIGSNKAQKQEVMPSILQTI